MLNLRTALVALSLAVAAAAPVAAQDFTNMDLSAMNNQWWAGQSSQMGTMTNQIIAQNVNDPQVQAMYYQAVQNGYYGSIEDFAFAYGQTAGFTSDGIARARAANDQITQDMVGQNSTFMTQDSVYGPAYGAYVNGQDAIMNQRGMEFGGY